MAEVIFVGCNKGDTYGEYGKTLWEQMCVTLCSLAKDIIGNWIAPVTEILIFAYI